MTIKRIGTGPRMSAAVVYGGVARLAGFVADKTVGKSVKEQTADILAVLVPRHDAGQPVVVLLAIDWGLVVALIN